MILISKERGYAKVIDISMAKVVINQHVYIPTTTSHPFTCSFMCFIENLAFIRVQNIGLTLVLPSNPASPNILAQFFFSSHAPIWQGLVPYWHFHRAFSTVLQFYMKTTTHINFIVIIRVNVQKKSMIWYWIQWTSFFLTTDQIPLTLSLWCRIAPRFRWT